MRLIYFKQLIAKFKRQQKESTESEAEESMMLDYLVKMQDSSNCGEPTHFSGKSSSVVKHNTFRNTFIFIILKIDRSTIALARFRPFYRWR
jgi:hypothetical protein